MTEIRISPPTLHADPLPSEVPEEQTRMLYSIIQRLYENVWEQAAHKDKIVREVRDHAANKAASTDLHDRQHSLGDTDDHTATTLALLNALISDATLDDSGDTRTPTAHNHTAAEITSLTFADARVAASNVTQHVGAIDHDSLLNYVLAQHRIINDAGTAATELWSASKINTELGSKLGQWDVTTGITASTTQTQGQGALTTEVNYVETCANANDTVTLPSTPNQGDPCFVRNGGAETLRIYPASGDSINELASDAFTTLAAGVGVTFVAAETTKWIQV